MHEKVDLFNEVGSVAREVPAENLVDAARMLERSVLLVFVQIG